MPKDPDHIQLTPEPRIAVRDGQPCFVGDSHGSARHRRHLDLAPVLDRPAEGLAYLGP
jgi:hypothetical protein